MMRREIEPYAFEPEYMENEEADYDHMDSDSSENLEGEHNADDDRLQNTRWCTCQRCTDMPSVVECYCCQESRGVMDKFNELAAAHVKIHNNMCITQTERFQTLCLDTDVLAISLIMIHNALRKGPVENPIQNR